MTDTRALSWPLMTAMLIGGIIVLLPLTGVRSPWLPSLWTVDALQSRLRSPLLPTPPSIAGQALPDLRRQNLVALLRAPMPPHLLVPVRGISVHALQDSFGAPRSGGRHHEGIDIFAPRYTPVLAATPGMILKVGHNRLGGNIVKVLGPGGYIHYYAHLSAFGPIHVREWVQAGDVIGYVGNSGDARTTPSHLHYGIYQLFGRHLYHAIDPYPYLATTPATPAWTGRPRLPALR